MRGECEKVFTLCAEGVIKSDTVRMESIMKKEMKSIIIYIMVCILALNHLGNSGLVVYAQDNETEETKIEKAIEDGAVETEKLSEVSNLRVKEQNASSVAIEWDKPVTGAVKQYEVYRDGSLVTQTDQLLYKDSAITKDCKYEYQIIAKGEKF